MDLGLKDKSVIVAASSQGIGRATAERFAAEGARVAMCARNGKALQAAADDIRRKYHVDVLAQACDVTDGTAVQQFVNTVVQRFSGVDVCVTNAGGPPAKNFLSISAEEWRKAVELNFMSVVHFAREVIPHMQRQRWGRIITLTSVAVRQPVAGLIMSNAVRSAVVGLVKSLSNEFGSDGILVNNVGPGYTETARLKELAGTRALATGVSPDDIKRGWIADIPQGRLGQPEEIADAIVWLASDRASYITGQTLLVDGGIHKGL